MTDLLTYKSDLNPRVTAEMAAFCLVSRQETLIALGINVTDLPELNPKPYSPSTTPRIQITEPRCHKHYEA
jgi:hypothetical protein